MAQFTSVQCSSLFPHYHPAGFGYDICKPLHTGGARVLNHWVIHYVFTGTGIFQTRGMTYHPKAGDMFIIRPNEWAYYAADEQDPWTYAWFDFQCNSLATTVLQQDIVTQPQVEHIFMTTYQQLSHYDAEARDAFLYGKLAELFGTLGLLYPAPEKPSVAQLIHQATLYIRANFWNRITVRDVAEHVHIEYYHFITLFRKHMGMTPGNYLTNCRLSYGATLLMLERRSTKETAALVGYGDTDTFSQAFKHQYGLSPQKYAEKYAPNALRQV